MKPPFKRAAATLTTCFCSVSLQPARAQVVTHDANGLYRNQSGGVFHSESGAQMDQMLRNNMAMSNAMTQIYLNQLQVQKAQEAVGNRVIRSGRATVTFPTRPWPMDYWMANTTVDKSISAEEDKRLRLTGMQQQQTYFAQQVAARGAKRGDMADMLSVATAIAVEVYTGKKLDNVGFREQSVIWRKALLKEAYYQGRTVADKQRFFEGQVLLNSSNAWWLASVKGDQKAARAQAEKFLDTWYTGKTPSVIRSFAANLSGSASVAAKPAKTVPKSAVASEVAPAAVKSAANADKATMTFAQAERLVLFSPVADSVLPDVMAQNVDASKRSQAQQLVGKLLGAGRERMHTIFTSPQGKENVADAVTYAILAFYTASKTTSGDPAQAGVTTKALVTLNQQITQMLASDAKFQAQTPRNKQLQFERAIFMATLVGLMSSEAQRTGAVQDAAQVKKAAENALQSLVGVPADKISITESGLQY